MIDSYPHIQISIEHGVALVIGLIIGGFVTWLIYKGKVALAHSRGIAAGDVQRAMLTEQLKAANNTAEDLRERLKLVMNECTALSHETTSLKSTIAELTTTIGAETPEYVAVELLLKGPELELPEGLFFKDKENIDRAKIRVRWWALEEGEAIAALAMPEPMAASFGRVTAELLNDLPNYPADAPPVFFGHYWLPTHWERAPLAANLASLDFSGAFGSNPLTAYRWNGERELTPMNFVTATA
jgi:hypothetical protein